MNYFKYAEQFYQAKQNEKRNRRKKFHSILSAYIYSIGFLGESVGIFFSFVLQKKLRNLKAKKQNLN